MGLTEEQRQAYMQEIPQDEREQFVTASDEDLQAYAELCISEREDSSELELNVDVARRAQEEAREARAAINAIDEEINDIIAEELGKNWSTNKKVMVPALLKCKDKERALKLAKEWGMEEEYLRGLNQPLITHADRVRERKSERVCCIMP